MFVSFCVLEVLWGLRRVWKGLGFGSSEGIKLVGAG